MHYQINVTADYFINQTLIADVALDERKPVVCRGDFQVRAFDGRIVKVVEVVQGDHIVVIAQEGLAQVRAGATYYVSVGSSDGGIGDFDLAVDFGLTPQPPSAAIASSAISTQSNTIVQTISYLMF